MLNYGYVKKISDEQYIVLADLNENNSGYDVVSKDLDPECMYDLEDVKRYVQEHPEMLFEHYLDEPSEERLRLEKELATLEQWMTDVYDMQVKQYQRCVRLGIPYDCKYGTIIELDALAKEKSQRIKEIRLLIANNN